MPHNFIKLNANGQRRKLPGYNPAASNRLQRHKRLVAKGIAPPGDKASLRAAAEQAVATFRKSSDHTTG